MSCSQSWPYWDLLAFCFLYVSQRAEPLFFCCAFGHFSNIGNIRLHSTQLDYSIFYGNESIFPPLIIYSTRTFTPNRFSWDGDTHRRYFLCLTPHSLYGFLFSPQFPWSCLALHFFEGWPVRSSHLRFPCTIAFFFPHVFPLVFPLFSWGYFRVRVYGRDVL